MFASITAATCICIQIVLKRETAMVNNKLLLLNLCVRSGSIGVATGGMERETNEEICFHVITFKAYRRL